MKQFQQAGACQERYDGADEETRKVAVIETKTWEFPIVSSKRDEHHASIGTFFRLNRFSLSLATGGIITLIGLFTGFGGFFQVMNPVNVLPYEAECFVQYNADPIIVVQIDSIDAAGLCQKTVQSSNTAWLADYDPATPVAGVVCVVTVGHAQYTVFDEGYTRGMDVRKRLSYDYVCARLGFDGRLPDQGF